VKLIGKDGRKKKVMGETKKDSLALGGFKRFTKMVDNPRGNCCCRNWRDDERETKLTGIRDQVFRRVKKGALWSHEVQWYKDRKSGGKEVPKTRRKATIVLKKKMHGEKTLAQRGAYEK